MGIKGHLRSARVKSCCEAAPIFARDLVGLEHVITATLVGVALSIVLQRFTII